MVELIYQKNGARRFYNTGLKAFKENWSLADQSFIHLNKASAKKLLPGIADSKIPTADEVKEFNGKLTKLRSHVEDIEKRYGLDNEAYSPTDVIQALKSIHDTTKEEAIEMDLFGFIDTYLADHAKTRVKGSLSVYRALKTHLQAYADHTRNKITFAGINYAFFESFQNFLIGRKKIVAGKSVPIRRLTTLDWEPAPLEVSAPGPETAIVAASEPLPI